MLSPCNKPLISDLWCRVVEGSLDPTALRVYIINCLSALEHTLAGHACCSARSQQLNKQISQQLSSLVSAQAGSVLGKSGLAEVADRLRRVQLHGED